MKNVYTVKQVNSYIKNMFTQDFMLNRIYVKGEVSNLKYHTSGHIYFSLKDESGTIACVMFAGSRSGLSFHMEEGQQVVVLGAVSVYERDGKYQLYAREIILDGAGLLYERFEALKKELEEMLNAYAVFTGGKGEVSCDYPAWMYKSDSKLRPIMIDTYEQMFGKAPVVATIHAGLECGLLSGQLPELDCVSFGPNMFDVHSVNEKLEVASVQRMWDYLLAVLKNCE